MRPLPDLLSVDDLPGEDFVERLRQSIDVAYKIYVSEIARGGLTFRGERVSCQYRPETLGKHFAFWHMMQEGKIEDERTIDTARMARVRWISWVIEAADSANADVRIVPQIRDGEKSWVLWLFQHDYAVILRERTGYYLLKTAFPVKSHYRQTLEKQWSRRTP